MRSEPTAAVLVVRMVLFVSSVYSQAPSPTRPIEYDWQETVQLVFCPVGDIEVKQGAVEFRARRFTFTFLHRDWSWRCEPARNEVIPEPATNVRAFERIQIGDSTVAVGSSTSTERASLELRRGSAKGEVLGMYPLWTREEGAEAQVSNPDHLKEVLRYAEAAEPFVTGVTSLQGYVWLAIGHYGSEGSVGVGTLLRLNPRDFTAELRKPPELADSTLGPMVAAGGRLWIGTFFYGEGAEMPTRGLVAYDPSKGTVKSYLPENSPIIGRMVLALNTEGDHLWVATENGLCRLALTAEQWTCWRIIPTVEVPESVPVSSLPLGRPRGSLRPGAYQVLWLKGDWLEVLTPDAVAGWTRPGSIWVRQPLPDDAHELLFNRDPLPPCDFLQGEPQEGARVVAEPCRGFVEPSSVAAQNGWTKMWARIGWIKKGSLSVIPRLVLERPGDTP